MLFIYLFLLPENTERVESPIVFVHEPAELDRAPDVPEIGIRPHRRVRVEPPVERHAQVRHRFAHVPERRVGARHVVVTRLIFEFVEGLDGPPLGPAPRSAHGGRTGDVRGPEDVGPRAGQGHRQLERFRLSTRGRGGGGGVLLVLLFFFATGVGDCFHRLMRFNLFAVKYSLLHNIL